jgi:aminoglycoside phosphotransferase (APT) family kinase protein
MIARLPSNKKYAPHILKEWSWLPKLRENLSVKIPSPIKLGLPSEDYPWHWLISKWIDGQSMNQISIANIDLHQLSIDISLFLNELVALYSIVV